MDVRYALCLSSPKLAYFYLRGEIKPPTGSAAYARAYSTVAVSSLVQNELIDLPHSEHSPIDSFLGIITESIYGRWGAVLYLLVIPHLERLLHQSIYLRLLLNIVVIHRYRIHLFQQSLRSPSNLYRSSYLHPPLPLLQVPLCCIHFIFVSRYKLSNFYLDSNQIKIRAFNRL